MKIAYILPKLANQGPIIVAKDIIDNIKDRIELIDVYYFDDVVEIDFECNIYKISFFDKIDFEKYDIVHSHMLRPDLYVWYHRKKSHIKTLFVSTLHQNIYENLIMLRYPNILSCGKHFQGSRDERFRRVDISIFKYEHSVV